MRTVLCGLIVFAVGCGTAAKPGTATKVYPRAEFREMLMGKTQDEVVKLIGKPDSTSDSGDVYWHFKDRTFDPVTGKPDHNVQVVFARGQRVRAVNY